MPKQAQRRVGQSSPQVVFVRCESDQKNALGNDSASFLTVGSLAEAPGGFSLAYAETSAETMKDIPVRIDCGADRIAITRGHVFSTALIFQKNASYAAQYHMPDGGVATAQLTTHTAECRRDGDGGSISLCYTMTLNGNERVCRTNISFGAFARGKAG